MMGGDPLCLRGKPLLELGYFGIYWCLSELGEFGFDAWWHFLEWGGLVGGGSGGADDRPALVQTLTGFVHRGWVGVGGGGRGRKQV